MHRPARKIASRKMDQKITIRIAEREYVMTARTPENEELIRLAAASTNNKINGFLAKYPGKSMVDILSFVALNESIGSLSRQRELEAVKAEADALRSVTDDYLNNIKGDGR